MANEERNEAEEFFGAQEEEQLELPGIEQEEPAEEETPAEGEVVEEAPAAPTPAQPEGVDEVAQMREQMARMAAILAQHGITPQQAAQAPQPLQQPVVPQAGLPVQGMPPAEKKPLISKEEFDAIFEDPSKLEGVLQRVQENAVEQVYRSVPVMVSQMIQQQTYLNGLVRDFYTANKDLEQFKPFVGFVAQEIGSQHPDWAVEQVFKETAAEVRKRLNIKQQALQQQAAKPGLPATRSTGRRAAPTQKLSALEQELQDLL